MYLFMSRDKLINEMKAILKKGGKDLEYPVLEDEMNNEIKEVKELLKETDKVVKDINLDDARLKE